MKNLVACIFAIFLAVPLLAASTCKSCCIYSYDNSRAKKNNQKQKETVVEQTQPIAVLESTCQTRVDENIDKSTTEKVQRCLTAETQEVTSSSPQVLVAETYDVQYPQSSQARRSVKQTQSTKTIKTYSPSETYQAYYDSEYPALRNDILPTPSAEEAHATALKAIRGETEEEEAVLNVPIGVASASKAAKSTKSAKSAKSSISRKSSTTNNGVKHTVITKETKIVIGDPNPQVQQTQLLPSDVGDSAYVEYYDPSPVNAASFGYEQSL